MFQTSPMVLFLPLSLVAKRRESLEGKDGWGLPPPSAALEF